MTQEYGDGIYSIKSGYVHRAHVSHHDDTSFTDGWQREVYERARQIADEHGYQSVVDVGCGSAYKLVHYLGHLDTLGVEVEPTLGWLLERYPDREWARWDSWETVVMTSLSRPCELVIAADVIEHFDHPDVLMDLLVQIPGAKHFVISTPDRGLVRGPGDNGPPANPCHYREWSAPEFSDFVGRWLEVVEHRITNRAQGTQMVVARPRS